MSLQFYVIPLDCSLGITLNMSKEWPLNEDWTKLVSFVWNYLREVLRRVLCLLNNGIVYMLIHDLKGTLQGQKERCPKGKKVESLVEESSL